MVFKNTAEIQEHVKAFKQKIASLGQIIKDIEITDVTIKDIEERRKQITDKYKQARTDDDNAIELPMKVKAALARYYESDAFKNRLLRQNPEMTLGSNEFMKPRGKKRGRPAAPTLHLMTG